MEQETIEKIKNKYKQGMKVELLNELDDQYSRLKIGDIGIIDHVDDIGTIHVNWENGSSLGLIPNVDKFELVEKIRVIMIEVAKEPYVKEIFNTLKDLQREVGGSIECKPSFFSKEKTYGIVCNRDGKKINLPQNRYIYDKKDAIFGNFMVVKTDDSKGDFISIEDNEISFLINQINEKCPKFDIKEYLKNEYEQEELEK